MSQPTFEIPKTCKAGVVVDEGPNFRVVSPGVLESKAVAGAVAVACNVPRAAQSESKD